ncbi:hypothetical protein, partial [Tahibacter caeni]|uniref:hypothetical protein n=1 Tax=Tahibacter caeni TaxID=1453545 RepID=UPI0021494C65
RAALAAARHDDAAAIAALRRAQALLADHYGAAHPLAAGAALELAAALHGAGQDDEARTVLAANAAPVEQNFAAVSSERRLLAQLRDALPR